jgi:MYXO-CTERM domain-containing protein
MSHRRTLRPARFFPLGALAILGALAATSVSRHGAASPPRPAAGLVQVPRNVHPFARPESDLGRLEPSKRLANLAIHFKPSAAQQKDLDALVQAVTDPASPEYHRWLTPEAYRARFGARPDDVARTVAWLRAQGFDTVDASSRLGLRVTFAGSVAQVESAFHTEMHRYRVGAETHYAMSAAPSVPADLADAVLAVYNAHDFYVKPMIAHALERGVVPQPFIDCPAGSTTCPSGTVVFAPKDWATMYDVPSSTYDGSGVTLMVVGVAQFATGDVQAYRTQFVPGAPSLNLTTTLVPNTGAAGNTQTGAGAEAILDVEWSSSLAPGAAINFVFTGSDDPNVFDAVFYAIEQNYGGVLSVSFGGSEQGLGTSIDADVLSQYGSAANVLGITMMVAAGDAAATTGERGANPPAASDGLYVAYPASMPNVTAVGGTQLPASNTSNFDSSGNALAYGASTVEEVWNESNNPASLTGVAGGGGGISTVFPRPAYQTATAAPACTPLGSLPVAGVTGAGYRQVPDVAFTAAEGIDGAGILIECSGFTIFHEDCSPTVGTETYLPIGGTSASSPSFAAVVALANQATGGRLGNINPLLYQLPSSVFHDVTSGNNEVMCTSGQAGCPAGGLYGYAAGSGYDCASGLGSVNAGAFIDALKGATTTTTTLAPVASPLAECDEVPLSATVTGTGSPTGTVTFAFQAYAANGAPDLTWTLGTAALSGGTAAMASPVTIPPGMVGSGKAVDLVAEYGGDTTHLPSTSPLVHVTFTPPTLCVTKGTVSTTSGATVDLVANGGIAPFRWYLSQDTTPNQTTGAGGSAVDENTGVFTAGTGEAGYSLVSVIDGTGAETFIDITVGSPTSTPWWQLDGGYIPNVCTGSVGDAGTCVPNVVTDDAGSGGGTNDGGSAENDGAAGAGGGLGPDGAAGGGTNVDDGGSGNGFGSGGSSSSGCSCLVAPSSGSPAGLAGALALGLAVVARRRRRGARDR